MQIKELDPSVNSFIANGNKYLVNGSLSVDRFERYEVLQSELAWGLNFEQLYNNLLNARALMNDLKLVDASVLVNNMLEGIARGMDKRTNPALMLCTLFISREGENLATWNEAEALEKIEDWKAEGYSAESFFALAFSFVKGYTAAFQASIGATL